MYEENERVLCKIDAAEGRTKGDRVTVTQYRIYKTGIDRFGRAHKKVVCIDSVTAAEYGKERFARYPIIGVCILALCCLLCAYFLPGGKTVRLAVGIAVLALGGIALGLSIAAYFRFTLKTILVYYAGGKMRIAAPGISDEEAEECIKQILCAAEYLKKKKKMPQTQEKIG